MQKYKATHVFDGPIDLVEQAREKRFENPDKFPDLKSRKEIERREEGNMLYSKRTMELSSNVPPALRKLLTPEMLLCFDDSKYDKTTGVHTWDIYSSYKKDLFAVKGRSEYKEFEENGERKTRRSLELTVEVKVPFVGGVAEQFILDAYKKNADKDVKTIQQMIKMMKEEAAG